MRMEKNMWLVDDFFCERSSGKLWTFGKKGRREGGRERELERERERERSNKHHTHYIGLQYTYGW